MPDAGADSRAAALNPMLVRELRQAAHSAAGMGLLWLLLIADLGIFYAMAVNGGREAGAQMFGGFAVVLGAIMLVVTPTTTFISLFREIRSRTMELVQITALSGRDIMWGRLQAAIARNVYVLALVAPFAVASYLFGGIDLVLILSTIYLLLISSVTLCALAVFAGSLAARRRAHMLGVVAYVLLMVIFVPRSAGWLVILPMMGGAGMGTVFYAAAWWTVWAVAAALVCCRFAERRLSPAARRGGSPGLVGVILVALVLTTC